MPRDEQKFLPIESIRERFNDAYDRADQLTRLVADHRGDGVDLSMLQGMLREAEVDKKAMLEALRLARHQTSVPYPASPPAQAALQVRRSNAS